MPKHGIVAQGMCHHEGAPFYIRCVHYDSMRHNHPENISSMKTVNEEIIEYQFYKWYINYGMFQNTQDEMDKPTTSVNTETKERKQTVKKTVKTKKQ